MCFLTCSCDLMSSLTVSEVSELLNQLLTHCHDNNVTVRVHPPSDLRLLPQIQRSYHYTVQIYRAGGGEGLIAGTWKYWHTLMHSSLYPYTSLALSSMYWLVEGLVYVRGCIILTSYYTMNDLTSDSRGECRVYCVMRGSTLRHFVCWWQWVRGCDGACLSLPFQRAAGAAFWVAM